MTAASSEGVRLTLTPASRGHRPGGTVHFLLHVASANSALSASVQLEDITIAFNGVERVDTSWVCKEYRKGVPALNADKRRVQRSVVSSTLRASTRGFGEEGCRVYLIRMRLPAWLPPTFRGVAVRYHYVMEVGVRWSERGEEREGRLKSSVCVWPLEEDDGVLGAGRGEGVGGGRGGGSTGGTGGRGVVSSLNWATVLDEGNALSGLALAQVPQIKCWEVGYGTTIEDAIENVELLRQDSANSVPYSPAYLSNSLSRTTSLDQPGARSSQQPAEMLSRRLFHAAQEAVLEEQRRVGVVTVTEEEAGVVGVVGVVGVGGNAPKTPIAGRARGDGNGAGRGAIRHWDGTGTGSTFRLRFADSVFATIHLHLANAMADGGGDEGDEGGDAGRTRGLAPGTSLVGTMEFVNEGRVQCVKYVVSLEMEETVAEAWRVKGREFTLNRIVEERTSLSPDTLASCVYFTVPSDATPSFESEVVTLAWGLRFHFYVRVDGSSRVETVEFQVPLGLRPEKNE